MAIDRGVLVLENRRISIRMEQLTDQLMARKGLTAAQANMLFFILGHSNEGTSLTDIHRKFGFSKAALCRILKYLRQNGYVRAEACLGDERRKILFGTEKGTQVQKFLKDAVCEACDQAYQGFSEEELRELDRLQKKMIQNLTEHHGEPRAKRSEHCEKSPTTVETV